MGAQISHASKFPFSYVDMFDFFFDGWTTNPVNVPVDRLDAGI